MTSTPPTIGRIVHYTLTDQDAARVNAMRRPVGAEPGSLEALGRSGGNHAQPGQTFPAMVVRTWGGSAVNLQVFLDGDDTLWVTSATESGAGTVGGCWGWPPRA